MPHHPSTSQSRGCRALSFPCTHSPFAPCFNLHTVYFDGSGVFCLLCFSEAYFVKPHKKEIRCHAHFPPSPGICLSLVSALAPRQTPAKCRFKLVPENTDQVTVMHKSVPFCRGKCLEIIVKLCQIVSGSCCASAAATPSPSPQHPSAWHSHPISHSLKQCFSQESAFVLHPALHNGAFIQDSTC